MTDTNRCILIIFFLHGDYADRRTKCPVCSAKLGPWIDDFKKLCPGCGYVAKKLDLWAYTLTFDDATLAEVRADVFGARPAQFYAAIEAVDEEGVRAAAPASPCFYCRSCQVGERVGCPNAGMEFD